MGNRGGDSLQEARLLVACVIKPGLHSVVIKPKGQFEVLLSMLKEEVDWGIAESSYETGRGEHT